MTKRIWIKGLLAGSLLAAGSAAIADVRAGVEAWTRGDFPAAVREWQGPAEQGDPDAQFNLAQAYKLGLGVPQDRARAEALYAQAAAQGHLQASDMYGLILFDKGERQRALPYIRAAADRGDPRAQYLLGVAHFNGELVPKDWTRAYALVSLAVGAGVPQAQSALTQMDQFIPLETRQQGIALSSEIAAESEATRARQLAAVDLGNTVPAVAAAATPPAIRPPRPAAPTIATAQNAVGAAAQVAGNDSPRTAGADYARPATPAVIAQPRPAAAPPAPAQTQTPRPAVAIPRPATAVAAAPAPAASGAWRVQLGAFGVAANADALWNRVRSRPELAGHPRINVRSGAVTRLLAGGFASQQEAQAACSRLSAAGFACIATRN